MADLSASLNTVTVEMPSLRAVVITRHAISPRFATKSLLIGTGQCELPSSAEEAVALGPSQIALDIERDLELHEKGGMRSSSVLLPKNAQVFDNALRLLRPLMSRPITTFLYGNIAYSPTCYCAINETSD